MDDVYNYPLNPNCWLHIYTNAAVNWDALANDWQANFGAFPTHAPGFWVKTELPAFPGQTIVGGDTSEWESGNDLEEFKAIMHEAIRQYTS